MGEKIYLGDTRGYEALETIELVLKNMHSSFEDLQGKYDVCMYQSGPDRLHDLGSVSYYLRAKASLKDFSQLKELRKYLQIKHGYVFLESHLINCRRCLRTLKIGLEAKPKLDKDELEHISAVFLLNEVDKKEALEEIINAVEFPS